MKKIIITILLLMAIVNSNYAQDRIDSLQIELQYMRYNIGKFHNQFKTGLIISVSGVAFSSLMLATKPDENGKNTNMAIVGVIGSTIAFTGVIVSLNSYKYLKRASIRPTNYGIGFLYDF